MKHPYTDILIAIAEGKEIQAHQPSGWINVSPSSVFSAILLNPKDALQPSDYRIKPATITINGVECEAQCDIGYRVTIISGAMGHPTTRLNFSTKSARDAAYAALIKPFESTP
jgi:hypothetical protein